MLCMFFFSPPSFPLALNQKKDDCGGQNPQDNKIPRIAKSPGQQNPGKSRARSASLRYNKNERPK